MWNFKCQICTKNKKYFAINTKRFGKAVLCEGCTVGVAGRTKYPAGVMVKIFSSLSEQKHPNE